MAIEHVTGGKMAKQNRFGSYIQAPICPQVDIKTNTYICWHSTGLRMRGHPRPICT